MIKTRNLAALLALSSVAVLPACSWFDGGSRSSRVGSPTRSYAATPNYNATPQAQTTELTPDMIRNVQQTLQQDGSYHGRVDGVWGPSTQAAVRGYQQQHNLNATGQLDQDTLAAMNLGGQNNAAQPPNQRYGSNYNPPPPPPPNNSNNPQPDNANQPTTNTTR
jgi:peptidoglycan hydrolase-like protein with peptidoglycan-binding domain